MTTHYIQSFLYVFADDSSLGQRCLLIKHIFLSPVNGYSPTRGTSEASAQHPKLGCPRDRPGQYSVDTTGAADKRSEATDRNTSLVRDFGVSHTNSVLIFEM